MYRFGDLYWGKSVLAVTLHTSVRESTACQDKHSLFFASAAPKDDLSKSIKSTRAPPGLDSIAAADQDFGEVPQLHARRLVHAHQTAQCPKHRERRGGIPAKATPEMATQKKKNAAARMAQICGGPGEGASD